MKTDVSKAPPRFQHQNSKTGALSPRQFYRLGFFVFLTCRSRVEQLSNGTVQPHLLPQRRSLLVYGRRCLTRNLHDVSDYTVKSAGAVKLYPFCWVDQSNKRVV